MEKEMIFLRKLIGRADGGCGKPRENFSNKGIFLTQSPKKFNTLSKSQEKKFFFKFSQGYVDCTFNNSAKTIAKNKKK